MVTSHPESAESRSARTEPALPAPMISTSLRPRGAAGPMGKAASGPDLRLEGADMPFPNYSGPQTGPIGDVVQPLQQQVADQTHGLGVVVSIAVPLHPVHDTVDDRRHQHDVSAPPRQ